MTFKGIKTFLHSGSHFPKTLEDLNGDTNLDNKALPLATLSLYCLCLIVSYTLDPNNILRNDVSPTSLLYQGHS